MTEHYLEPSDEDMDFQDFKDKTEIDLQVDNHKMPSFDHQSP